MGYLYASRTGDWMHLLSSASLWNIYRYGFDIIAMKANPASDGLAVRLVAGVSSMPLLRAR